MSGAKATATSTGWAWRVVWHRADWAPNSTQYRIFGTEHAARAHLAKLSRDDRPELSPLVVLRLERRPVGRWQIVEHGP